MHISFRRSGQQMHPETLGLHELRHVSRQVATDKMNFPTFPAQPFCQRKAAYDMAASYFG
jgi:hypothetical protein